MKPYFLIALLWCAFCAPLTLHAQTSVFRQQQLHSAILDESRTINIYLPDTYSDDDTTHYPVVYLPDGGLSEDFLHVAGLMRFDAQSWVNRFPKAILIGIENTNRQRDFTYAVADLDFLKKVGFSKERIPQYGGSGKYISFIQQELMPYIADHYRVSGRRIYIGESLAGLLGTELLLYHRELFDTYFIFSPSLWWGNEKLLQDAAGLLAHKGKKQVNVFIAAPAKDEMPLMYEDAKALYDLLQKDKETRSWFEYLPDETHATVMHEALYRAFRKLSVADTITAH
ncbi:alpha/beta hydrolase [Rurimicrobium arvi]|uniref:Alpha/beta hydrolase-fold protein n=1 Tax=Rurimicrobium arvi TaxID=2049916 RepID=A0ABP8MQ73_9BACT